jgi:lysophospholipase L1-like esterase
MSVEFETLQWIDVRDERLEWLNVADWEPRKGGLQPVRVPKAWRDQWPAKTARRGMAAAGMAVRFRTDSTKLVFSVTFVDSPDAPPSTPAAGWERSRPPFFSLYRGGKYLASMAGIAHFDRQEVMIYNDREFAGEVEVEVLLPFYYRNAEVIMHGIGIEADARLLPAPPDLRPRVFFHGDSITQGHGVTSPRETYVRQVADRLGCVGINYGFGGTAWADNIVAQTIASRRDWDILVIMLGTNSFAGADADGRPETAKQYAQKYEAFLKTIRAAAPEQSILCVTPILNRADLERGGNQNGERPELYREGITRVVRQRQIADANLYLADGLQMVDDPLFLLVTDRVHPNDAGMHRIADGVAAALKPLVEKVRRMKDEG